MKLVERPYFMPGHCMICRSANREQYIDTHVAFEFEGHVYICDKCIVEMADMIAYVPKFKINAGFPGLVAESIDALNRAKVELDGKFDGGLRSLSAIASSLAGLAQSQEQYYQHRITQLRVEGQSESDESIDTSGNSPQRTDPGPSSEASSKKLGANSSSKQLGLDF